MDIFWGHHKAGLFLGIICIHFQAFFLSEVKKQNEVFLVVAKIKSIFGVMPDLFFW